MLNTKKYLQNPNKKINFVFFINSEKTHHFKMNYIIFKLLCILFSIILFILFFSFIYALKSHSKNKELNNYVLNLKKNYIKEYLESHFSGNTLDEINDHNPSAYETDLNKEASLNDPPSAPVGLIDSPKNEKKIQKESAINSQLKQDNIQNNNTTKLNVSLDKFKVSSQDKKLIVSFWIVNNSKDKFKPITGAICGKAILNNQPAQTDELKYPNSLEFNKENLPNETCLKGENVKFNRLRPTTLSFEADQIIDKVKNIKIYFYDKSSKSSFLLKDYRGNS